MWWSWVQILHPATHWICSLNCHPDDSLMHIIRRCMYQHSSYKPKISSNSVTPPTEGTTRYIYYYLHLTACLDNWSHKCVIKVIITAWCILFTDVRTSTPVTISRAAAGASHLQEMEKQGIYILIISYILQHASTTVKSW